MKEMGHGPKHGREGHEEDFEFSIARSNALIPLLIMFGVTVLLILIVIVRARPIGTPEGAIANKAFGPADFPAVFAEGQDPLAGLDRGDARASSLVFPVPAPPFSEGIYPCSQCHDTFPPNPERRPLEAFHGDIELRHDEEHRWCLDCHDENNRDQLRLASGGLVPFTESYRLCGQCHGTQFRDWRIGIHGKRTGYFDGAKRYLLCVHCHNPHSPRFAAIEPLPPPLRPQFLGPEGVAAAQTGGGQGAAPAEKEAGHGG